MFEGLHIALSGVRAAQVGLDTATNNVANANTPGHTRQRLLATVPARYNARRRDESVTVDALPDTPLRDELLELAAELGYAPELV